MGGRRVILLREEVLPLVHLGKALQGRRRATARSAAEDGTPVVVVDFEGRKIGLQVEKIIGTREIVIKSLSRHYREIDGLIGASILGNGRIALIIDVETLISRHHGGAGANGHGTRKGIVDIEAREEAPGSRRSTVAKAAAPLDGRCGRRGQRPAAPLPAPEPPTVARKASWRPSHGR